MAIAFPVVQTGARRVRSISAEGNGVQRAIAERTASGTIDRARTARARRAAVVSAVVCALAVGAPDAGAQGTAGARGAPRADSTGLPLEAAIAHALEHAPDIDIARRQYDIARGNVELAGAAFDVTMKSSVLQGADHAVSLSPTKPDVVVPVTTSTVRYGVSADKAFRAGVTVTPALTITRSDQSTSSFAPPNTATASLAVGMPLLRGRRGGTPLLNERAAEVSLHAAQLDVRQSAAQTILAVVGSYWSYVGAARQLGVYQQSEERARQLVDLTGVLVTADERPRADLNQARANLASKRAARINAEQTLVEARQTLGLALGLPAADVLALPAASSDFPAAVRWAAAGALPVAAYERAALSRRVDLAAAGERRASAALASRAALADLRQQLDLTVTVGYTGVQRGSAFGSFFSPLYTNVPGLNASVQFGYGFPAQNSAARGRLLQTTAAQEQAEIGQARLARAVRTGVVVAATAVQSSLAGLETAELAVSLSAAAVESEKEKFRLGASTLFEQIQAEDALTSAQLGEIGQRQRYATALARLRYELGELVRADGPALSVDVEALRVPPSLEAP